MLVYKGIKLAAIEAKSDELPFGEGVMQAKKYAQKLQLETTYRTNGKEIYQICMKTVFFLMLFDQKSGENSHFIFPA